MSYRDSISRRGFLGAAAASPLLPGPPADPLVDYHVHLDKIVTLEKALELSQQRGVKFGIVEHAGKKEFRYAGLLSTDADLKAYLARLAGKPVYKGIQAEGLDWMGCFSAELVAQLDYVLSDALTMPQKDGTLARIWLPSFAVQDKQDWMDRYTDFNVQVIEREPIDILANPTFLPAALEKEYDSLWTRPRMKRVIDAAAKHQVAIEVNSRYRLPSLAFIKLARQAGVRFSFGSNIHGLEVGRLDYCVEVASQLGITQKEMFQPAPPGRKPIQVRRFTP